ncbi:MAG: PfkB family carbohydrate kinase [Clostridiales bacterium]|nr:PfkB family carbohydrate kinase [Clostridiales bacterium]
MDLYSIGEMVIDFIPGSESVSYIRKAGGAPANVAFAAAKNGLEAGMNCSVGDDDFGHFLMDTLKKYNVRTLNPKLCKEAVTTLAFVTLAEDGDRSFTFARKPGADMFLSEDDVKEEDIENSAVIHAGSCSLSASPSAEATIKALRLGKEKGKIVSFDVNYRDIMWNYDKEACAKKVFECFPYIDILKISEEEVEMMGGEEGLPKLMEKYGLTVIAETLGGDGAQCFFKGKVIKVPGRKAVCVDATGAGDAFWGGFLSCLRICGVNKTEDITEEILLKAVNYGNVAGWLCVQNKGAIESLPFRADIEKHL